MSNFSGDEIDQVNRAASFLPQTEWHTRPCLTVGGVQIYGYFDESGTLVISVHLDDAEARFVRADATVPMTVIVGLPVWDNT